MYKIKIDEEIFDLTLKEQFNGGSLNKEAFEMDVLEVKEGVYHILKNHVSYKVEVLDLDRKSKTVRLKVNDHIINVEVEDQYDSLLKSLGIEKSGSKILKELKAPMPGLVLEVDVKVGDIVKEKDSLLILEAMKMENVLKSPIEGVIKAVHVVGGNTVEKNEVLLEFE